VLAENFKAIILTKVVSRGHSSQSAEDKRGSDQLVIVFFILSGRVAVGQQLLSVSCLPSPSCVLSTRSFQVRSIMDMGHFVESVSVKHCRKIDVSQYLFEQKCCFSISIDDREAFNALSEGDFLYSPVNPPPPPPSSIFG
jgi:hypothetical protein